MENSQSKTGQAVSSDKIIYRLREMFGEDRAELASGDQYRVDDEIERAVAFPRDIEELSEMMRLASGEGWRVIPAGAGTWLEMGARPERFDLVVSTAKMSRALEYEPADLTATVEAGVALGAFNRTAAEYRQFIPLDPFGDERSTIGGVIATASSGPLRCAYGTPRDWLIGVAVVAADGRITRAGGKVVKNVAGYDLCKLYAGSFGTLAVIAEASFKLRALPSCEKTVAFYSRDAEPLCSLAARITDSDVQPAAMELIAPYEEGLPPLEAEHFALVLRCRNEAETIDWQIEEAARLGSGFRHETLGPSVADEFWRAYHESETSPSAEFLLRLSALPADLNALIADVNRVLPPVRLRAHAANGVVRLHGDARWLDGFKTEERLSMLAEIRRLTRARGGQTLILRAPGEIKSRIDVWGEPGPTEGLMRALKGKFDPHKLLNPGRFVAGI
ncbi:MAG: FAD-binding oxidoreductase [Blastocatellia bacterium]|nr:FAD-binding oxidoreductase [Blastocatellia bacterium]